LTTVEQTLLTTTEVIADSLWKAMLITVEERPFMAALARAEDSSELQLDTHCNRAEDPSKSLI